MDKYQIFVTRNRSLKSDIEHWEAKGYEIVSHAVCPNNNLSFLVKQTDKSSANKPVEDAVVKDADFDLIVLSALRYALPRHSYMPATVRGYILRHWTRLQNKHWAILSDIREYICDTVKWHEDHKEDESYADKMDLDEWVKFYNELLVLKDTHLDANFQHLKEPISLELVTPVEETNECKTRKYTVHAVSYGSGKIDSFAVRKGNITVVAFFCDSDKALSENDARIAAECECNRLND